MKYISKSVLLFTVLISCNSFFATGINAQDAAELTETQDDEMDWDILFDDAEDTHVEESAAPVVSKVENSGSWNLPIRFTGSFTAGAGIITALTRDDSTRNTLPAAYATGNFGLIFKPSDKISVTASVSTTIPTSPSVNLNTFYMDYNLWDRAFLTAGKVTKSWKNSELVSTTETFSPGIALAALDIPLPHGANIETIICLNTMDKASFESMDYAAAIQFPLFGFSFKPFCRVIPDKQTIKSGLYLSGDLFTLHVAAYGNAKFANNYTEYSDSDFAIEAGRYWEVPQKIGFMAGYESNYSMTGGYKQTVKLTTAWSHVGGSIFTPIITGTYEITNNAFTVIPATQISGILPHATVYAILPMIYGNTSYTFDSDNSSYTTLNGAEDKFKLYMGLFIKISASF